jgi:hypothetical protein
VGNHSVGSFRAFAALLLGLILTAGHSEIRGGTSGPEKRYPAKEAKADPKKQAADSLTLVNESGQVSTLSPAELAKLPHQTVRVKDRSGVLATYQGVPLAELLRAAKVALGKDLKGPFLANCLLVEAADGYGVTFSLPEVDPDITNHLVLIADQKNAKPLDAGEGPYRLIVPDDKKHARWVRQVIRISVQATTAIRAGTRDK